MENEESAPGLFYTSAEPRSESFHKEFAFEFIVFLTLIMFTLLAIWFFKHFRIRLFHETGVAMIMGILFGLFLHLYYSNNASLIARETLDICEVSSRVVLTKDEVIFIRNGSTTLEVVVSRNVLPKENTDDLTESLFLFNTEIFFYILLPPIIFYAGYTLKKRHFFRNLISLLTFAFFGTTISCFVIGSILFAYSKLGFEALPKDFGLIHGLLFGSLISATDPVTVLAIFHDLHVDVDLYALVFGESVMNDAVAIVLYTALDEFEQSTESGFQWAQVFVSIGKFVGIFIGSFLLGIFIGLVTAIITKIAKLQEYPVIESTFFVVISYFTFPLAESLGLTGIVAILFCGITQSHYTYINLSEESRGRTKDAFELMNFISENFLFSYMGVSLFTYPFHQWKPGFIGFAFIAIAVGRVLNIVPLALILNTRRSRKIQWTFQAMLLFAGLRGAIAFALAIRNTDTEIRQLFYTTTLIIVFVTVVVCGGLTYFALILLRIRVGVKEDRTFREEGEIITYDPLQGNYLISRFTSIDKKYFIPFFTIRGTPLVKLCPGFLSFPVRLFDRNKKLVSEGTEEHVSPFYSTNPEGGELGDSENEINTSREILTEDTELTAQPVILEPDSS